MPYETRTHYRPHVQVTTPQIYEDSCFTNFPETLPDSTYITINYLMLKWSGARKELAITI